MRYDPEQKARTRERVLTEAVAAIRAGGPENLGVADVMKRAGLTHGGFYAHFESREALLVAAVERMFEGAKAMLDRRTRNLPPREGLAAYVAVYLSPAHRDMAGFCCPLPLLSGDLPRMPAPARDRFSEGVAGLTASLSDKLREIGHGEPGAAAGSALSEMIGALSVARALGPTAQSDAVLATSRAAVVSRLGLEPSA